MKTIAVIPSRYGSTRFCGKPLALIAGKAMIQRVYENAASASDIADVIVATDDSRIADAVKAFRGKVMMTSPANRSGTDRVAEVAEKMGLEQDDIVVNVQGDQPLLDPRCAEDVTAPLRLGMPDTGCEMTTLAFRIVNEREITDPKDVKVTFDTRGFALYFSRSPIPYARDTGICFDTYKHLGVYAYTRRFLEIFRKLPRGKLEEIEQLEQLRVLEYGYKIKVIVTDYDSPEVDIPEDIARIEKVMLAQALHGKNNSLL